MLIIHKVALLPGFDWPFELYELRECGSARSKRYRVIGVYGTYDRAHHHREYLLRQGPDAHRRPVRRRPRNAAG